jgi:hypothetical protein
MLKIRKSKEIHFNVFLIKKAFLKKHSTPYY